MNDVQRYAKDAVKTLKVSEVNPFDEIKALAEINGLDICRGIYTSWEVCELMLMVDYMLRQQKTRGKQKK